MLITLFVLLTYAPPAAATRADRLRLRAEAISCAQRLAPGEPDFSRGPGPRRGRGAADYLRHLGLVVQSKHDRRAWAVTRSGAVELWDQFFVREAFGEGWVEDFVEARDRLDDHARELLRYRVRNPRELLEIFPRLQNELLKLKRDSLDADRARRIAPTRRAAELRVRGDDHAEARRLAGYLARVTPAGAPALPAEWAERLGRDRRVGVLLAREVQTLRRLARVDGGRELALRHVTTTYTLLAKGLSPDEIMATRGAVKQLVPRSFAARELVMADIARVPLFARVVREVTEAKPRAHARLSLDAYLAYLRPDWLPPGRSPGDITAEAERLVHAREVATDYEFTQDVELAITEVIMDVGESEPLRTALKTALTLMPWLMDPDAPALASEAEPINLTP